LGRTLFADHRLLRPLLFFFRILFGSLSLDGVEVTSLIQLLHGAIAVLLMQSIKFTERALSLAPAG
jgi:hypothetical protein